MITSNTLSFLLFIVVSASSIVFSKSSNATFVLSLPNFKSVFMFSMAP